jgi:hypothetical protein
VTAYVTHDLDTGRQRTIRELVAEFRGLTATTKQKAVLDETGLSRTPLVELVKQDVLQTDLVGKLLAAMQKHTKPVQPNLLGPIGKENLAARFQALGCERESFTYQRASGMEQGLPWLAETAFGWCPGLPGRRLVTGVNWSPGLVNPFRELGRYRVSLDSVLESQRAGQDEPICFFLHLICPRVEFTDRGKSAVVIAH